jgi:hypothetical protein
MEGISASTVNRTQTGTMVMAAANIWNAGPTAAVKMAYGGGLAEDVSGANVTSGPNGVIMPADIRPTATNRPVAIVRDADGSVIDAFFGKWARHRWHRNSYTLSVTGQPTRLFITAVTGESATLNFELDKYP